MNLEILLQSRGIGYEKHRHPTAYTAQGLAHVEHVSGFDVAKPVVVRGSSGFTMCVIPAPKRLDLNRVAQATGACGVHLVHEWELAELFPDCELGAEPPVGTLFGMPTLIDSSLCEQDFLLMQAGTHTDSIKLRRRDLQRCAKARVVRIATS